MIRRKLINCLCYITMFYDNHSDLVDSIVSTMNMCNLHMQMPLCKQGGHCKVICSYKHTPNPRWRRSKEKLKFVSHTSLHVRGRLRQQCWLMLVFSELCFYICTVLFHSLDVGIKVPLVDLCFCFAIRQ